MKKGFLRIIKVAAGMLAVLLILGVLVFAMLNRTNGDITSAGIPRKYLLYVPESYDPLTPTPLVISMHGFGGWPRQQMYTSRWDEAAEEYGFIVVFPMGTGFPLRWVASLHPGTAHSYAEEVTFITDLIDRLAGEYNIDRARVYANGLSNGGGMGHLLACELSDQVAAIGGVGGAYVYPDEACSPSRPVPVIAFHGTDDRIVAYDGFNTTRFDEVLPEIPSWAAEWAERNGCDTVPEEIPRLGEVSGVHYVNCEEGADVIFYTVHGGGHTWPGGRELPYIIARHTTQDIDATREMWVFFSRYALPEGE